MHTKYVNTFIKIMNNKIEHLFLSISDNCIHICAKLFVTFQIINFKNVQTTLKSKYKTPNSRSIVKVNDVLVQTMKM